MGADSRLSSDQFPKLHVVVLIDQASQGNVIRRDAGTIMSLKRKSTRSAGGVDARTARERTRTVCSGADVEKLRLGISLLSAIHGAPRV